MSCLFPQNKDQAFENNQELHIPAILDDDTPHADVLHHAWIEFVGDCYPQFLRLDDFNVEATKELDIFYQRVGSLFQHPLFPHKRSNFLVVCSRRKLEKEAETTSRR